jgi:meso-butanediol dehydrogenase / (S,S)-butanediol dehydrogenase / diacetyl reductase
MEGSRQGDEDMKLEGKVALITGGGTGIGAAIAERFVADGAKVCIVGRRQEMLDKLARSLPLGTVVTCSGDVSNNDDAKRMVEAALTFGGGLNVLVNNAAMDQDPPATVTDIDSEIWRRILEVNLTGPFLLMKASIPHMIKSGGGSIINVSSLAGLRSIPAMPAYCASKGGLIKLTQQVALDYGPSKIRCNVVCPGGVRTAMAEAAMGHFLEKLGTDLDGFFDYFSSNVPLRRVAAPHEISGLFSYLASDDSSFMTGAVLVIDGGAAVVDISGAAISSLAVK